MRARHRSAHSLFMIRIWWDIPRGPQKLFGLLIIKKYAIEWNIYKHHSLKCNRTKRWKFCGIFIMHSITYFEFNFFFFIRRECRCVYDFWVLFTFQRIADEPNERRRRKTKLHQHPTMSWNKINNFNSMTCLFFAHFLIDIFPCAASTAFQVFSTANRHFAKHVWHRDKLLFKLNISICDSHVESNHNRKSWNDFIRMRSTKFNVRFFSYCLHKILTCFIMELISFAIMQIRQNRQMNW